MAELVRRLREEQDVAYQPRWLFREGRLEGYPTLHAAYIAALCAIEGPESTAALAGLMRERASLEEGFLIASELARRGAAGWAGALLERADAEPEPARLPVQLAAAELAARADAGAAVRRLLDRAPRGEDGRDPRILASTLGFVPLADAAAAAEGLLRDPEVTRKAKTRAVRALLGRTEWETLEHAREMVARGGLDEETRTAICNEAANGPGFLEDIAEHQQAVAKRDRAMGAAVHDRFLRRMEAMRRLVSAALDVDFETSEDARAAALRRRLESYREQFEGG